jgi:hypothetical protein
MKNGWNFMCNVDKIVFDVDQRLGELWLPEMNYPDMSSTIKNFTSVDPEIRLIQTFVGGKLDIAYVKIDSGWEAQYHE